MIRFGAFQIFFILTLFTQNSAFITHAAETSPCEEGSLRGSLKRTGQTLGAVGRWLVPRMGRLMAIPDPSCKTDPNDRFEEGFRINWGPNKGICVDTGRRRFPRALTEVEAKTFGGNDDGSTLIANFRHDEKFWVARIPKGEIIEEVIGQKVHYFLGQSHVQLRFKLKSGQSITLYPQSVNPDSKKTKSVRINDFSWSSSSAHLQGQEDQHPIKSLVPGNTAAVNMLMSHEQRLAEEPGHLHTQHKIQVSPTVARSWLDTALAMSEDEGFEGRITMLNRNCINGLCRMLDQTPQGMVAAHRPRPSIPAALYGELNERGFPSIAIEPILSPNADE